MSDPKLTAVYYLRLNNPTQHLSYIQHILQKRNLDSPYSPIKEQSKERLTPFNLANRIITHESKASQKIWKKEKIVFRLLSDRVETAKLLANESSEPAFKFDNRCRRLARVKFKLVKKERKRANSTAPKTCENKSSEGVVLPQISGRNKKLRTIQESYGIIPGRRLHEVNSIISVCSEEELDNTSYKSALRSTQERHTARFRSFAKTLQTLEDLSEHGPDLLQKLYSHKVSEDQENRLDAYLMSRELRRV